MAVASQKLYNPCVLGVNHLHKLVHGHSSFVVQLAFVLIQRVQTRPVSLIVTDWFEESHLNPPSFRVILASIGRPETFVLYISRFHMGFEEFEQ